MLRLKAIDLEVDKAPLFFEECLSFVVQAATTRPAPQCHRRGRRIERLDVAGAFK